MPWMRLSVMLLMVSLVGLTNGCGNKSRRASATASETASATPDGVYWEGQSQSDSRQGGRSVTTKNLGRLHPFDQVSIGETYDSVVARFGPPTRQIPTYEWSTMSGKFSVTFDEQQNATHVFTDGQESPERDQEIRELVAKHASLTTISAHLPGSPEMASSRSIWVKDGHQLSVEFWHGKVEIRIHEKVKP